KLLASGLLQLLEGQAHPDKSGPLGFFSLFQEHPLIADLHAATPARGKPGRRKSGRSARLPAYLSAPTFATAVMDVATDAIHKKGAITFSDLEAGVKQLDDGEGGGGGDGNVKTALLALLQNCNDDVGKAQQRIEAWFNEFMDRVTGRYKRWIQL